MTVYTFALKRSFRDKTNLLFLMFFPIAAIFLPSQAYWPSMPLGYQYFGILILFVAIRLTGLLLEDRQKGVVKRVAAAPISHFRYLLENLLAFATIMLGQCVVVIVGGVLYGQELYQPFLLFILYLAFSLTAIALALAWNSFYRSRESSFLIFMSVIILISLLGGLIVPYEMLPEWIQKLAVVLPTYWLYKGIEWIVHGGEAIDFIFINSVLFVYSLLLLIVGSIRRIG